MDPIEVVRRVALVTQKAGELEEIIISYCEDCPEKNIALQNLWRCVENAKKAII